MKSIFIGFYKWHIHETSITQHFMEFSLNTILIHGVLIGVVTPVVHVAARSVMTRTVAVLAAAHKKIGRHFFIQFYTGVANLYV